MKAAVLKGPKQLVVEVVDDPTPGAGEVLIKMKYCGICGSDLHIYQSPLTPPGSIMGHEWVGEVAELGPGTTDWSVGDRVWPGGDYVPGWSWKPEYGWDQEAWVRDSYVKDMGGYGELAVYHQKSISTVPGEVSDIDACMADQAATALGALHTSGFQIGESVFIIGAGPIGLWTLRCAQLAGARAICVAEIIEGRAQKARQMGSDLVVDSNQPGVREQVAGFLGGTGPDVVVECVGTASALQLAIDLVRPDGRIALVGISREPVAISTWNMYLKAVKLLSVRDLDFPGGMELIRAKKIDCQEFLTEIIDLDRAPEAFQALLEPVDQEKIIIGY